MKNVKCPICQQEYKQITSRHLKMHSMSTDDFRIQYPSLSLVSDEVRLKNQDNGKKGQELSRIIAGNKKHHRIEQYNKQPKICLQCNSPIPFIKRMNQFCSSSCSASFTNSHRKHTEKTKRKISLKLKECYSGAARDPLKRHKKKKSPPVYIRCKECNKVVVRKYGSNQKYCSDVCRKKNSGGYRKNSTKVHRTLYKGFQMDSGAERVFAEMLDTFQICWIKNTSTFFSYTFNKKSGKYYPDFFLPKHNLWIEIKGKKYIRDGDTDRLNSVGNILLIMSTELKQPNEIIDRIKQHSIY